MSFREDFYWGGATAANQRDFDSCRASDFKKR